MNIDLELAELIHKYHVDAFVPDFYSYYKAVDIAKRLYAQSGNVVLTGTKQTDIEWFQRNICGENVKTLLLGDDIDFANEELKQQETMFLLVSYYGRDEAMVQLLESGCRPVCLYDVFEKNNIFFQRNFYDVYSEEYVQCESNEFSKDFMDFDINRIFFYHRRRYELETDQEIRKEVLKKLIFDCAYARDFLTLKKYIDIFQEEFAGEERERYLLFYKEVEELLLQIKNALADRDKKDCIVLWLDALEYGEDADMPFLNGLNGNSLVFSNAYTVTPYTRATFNTLFAKRREVEEESYKIKKVGIENSSFIDGLKRRNYKFLYYGKCDFAEQQCTSRHLYGFAHGITQIYWDIIGDILLSDNENSFFCILHEVPHTHHPFISMGISGKHYHYRHGGAGYQPNEKLTATQALESREYVDRQLDFFDGLLPDRMYKIYMSDHGHTFMGRYHCILKVQQEFLKPQVCQALISWYDFDKLVFGLLDNGSVNEAEIQNDFCIIQDVEYYNKDIILTCLKRKEVPTLSWLGYQGVVTKEDIFIRYNNGTELYKKHCNDQVVVTDARLDYLRGIISKKRIDIATEEKFKYSYMAHRVMDRCAMRTRERQEKKLSIIREVFEEIRGNEMVALRGGGLHSVYLLMLLDEKSRKKIYYIIDRDKECWAGKMGIKVITMEETGNCRLDKVIISSFQYRDAWKTECLQNLQAEVIDLYELFEQQDIYCREEFYNLEYEDQDFEGIVP